MNIQSAYKVGYILKPHGLKGEVTVSLDDDAPETFDDIDTIFIQQAGQLVPFFMTSITGSGKKAYIKFEDVDTPEAASKISKSALFLPKSSRPKSARGEFYDDEIIGFQVTDSTLGELGRVTEITNAGLNKLIAIDYQGKEILVPVNSPFITSINKSKKRIMLELPEGFIDI